MGSDVDLSLRQFLAAWRLLCRDAPGYAHLTRPGLELVFSGLPVGFFNVAFVTQAGLDGGALPELAREASRLASPHGVPWMLAVTLEGLAPGTDAAGALAACDLAPAMPLTGMLARRVEPCVRPPEGLRLERARDDDACRAIVDVNSAAYGVSLDAARDVVGRAALWRGHVPVLGTVAGQAACSATVLHLDGLRYVALVATAPGLQRRGYADAAMRHALQLSAAEQGDSPSVLHATDAGRPVYRAMGYAEISAHVLFMERRFLAAP